MAYSDVCEVCVDSIGDRLCVDCHKIFCSSCKNTHLSLGNFPSHIIHNVTPTGRPQTIELNKTNKEVSGKGKQQYNGFRKPETYKAALGRSNFQDQGKVNGEESYQRFQSRNIQRPGTVNTDVLEQDHQGTYLLEHEESYSKGSEHPQKRNPKDKNRRGIYFQEPGEGNSRDGKKGNQFDQGHRDNSLQEQGGYHFTEDNQAKEKENQSDDISVESETNDKPIENQRTHSLIPSESNTHLLQKDNQRNAKSYQGDNREELEPKPARSSSHNKCKEVLTNSDRKTHAETHFKEKVFTTYHQKSNTTTMSESGIENLAHHYGDAENASIGTPSVDTENQPQDEKNEKTSPDTGEQTDTNYRKSPDNSELNHQNEDDVPATAREPISNQEKKINIEDKDDKHMTNQDNPVVNNYQEAPGVNSKVSKQANSHEAPDKVQDEQDKRIFQLTESENDKDSKSLQEMPVVKKTNAHGIKTEKTAYSILEFTSVCKQHDEDFAFICDRCDVPVCKICVVRDHKGHQLSDIDETARIRENALESLLSPRIAGAERNSTEMGHSIAVFDSEIDAVNKAIRSHGEYIKELTDKQVALMLTQVKERADRKRNKFIELNESLEEAVEKGKRLQQRHHELVNSKTDGALILKLKKLSQDARTFHYPSVPNIPSVMYHAPKVIDVDIERLFGSCNFINADASITRFPRIAHHASIDLDQRTPRLPRIIPPPNILNSPRHRWQCCRCGTEQQNDTIRVYNNNTMKRFKSVCTHVRACFLTVQSAGEACTIFTEENSMNEDRRKSDYFSSGSSCYKFYQVDINFKHFKKNTHI